MAALGRLAILVEADIAKFTSDMGRADRIAKRSAQEMERSLNRGFAAITTAATVAGLAVAAMAKKAIDAADESAKMAQRIGVSVEALGGLKHAADQTGVSVQQLQTGLTRIARSAADAAGGLKQQQAVWQALGISVTDASGALRSTEAIFGDVVEAFSKMEDGAAKTAIATRIFGRAGAELIPMLNQGRAGLDAFAREARALGIVIDTQTAKAAEQFNDNLAKLQQGVNGLANDLMRAFLPTLVETTEAMVAWVKQLRETGALDRLVEQIKAFIKILDELAVFIITKLVAQAIIGFVGNLVILGNAMKTAGVAAGLLRGGMMALAGPIGVVAAGVAAIVTWYYKSAAAASESERNTRLLAEATADAAKAVDGMADASKKQIQEEMNRLAVTRKTIENQIDLAKANLAVAESEAAIANERNRASQVQSIARFATGNVGGAVALSAQGATEAAGAQAAIDAARERIAMLQADFVRTSETYDGLIELLSNPSSAAVAAPIVELTGAAERAQDELAKLMETAEAFANSTISSLTERFNPLLAIQLQYEESLRNLAPLLTGTAEQQTLYAEAVAALARAKEADVAQTREQIAQQEAEKDIIGSLNRDYREQTKMLGMSRRELVGYQAATQAVARAQATLGAELNNMPGYLEQVAKTARENEMALYDMQESAQEVESILSRFDDMGFDSLTEDIKTVEKALAEATKKGADGIERMQAALTQMNAQMQQRTLGSYRALLGAAQAFTQEGSKGFNAMQAGMAALSIIQDVIALKAAVSAVLTQGQGDPYSAWARMAAMAAAVAPFVASIGVTLSSFGGGGGGPTSAETRQQTQGTGTVLGAAEEKSQSILNAVEITANATTALVGINRGMLRALVSLQNGIGAATGMLARGAGSMEFEFDPGTMLNWRNGAAMGAAIGSIVPIIGTAIGAVVGALVGGLLRGSSRVSDRGIVFGGGSLEDMGFQAYQENEVRRWRFGSRRTTEQRADLPENLANQFGLIIESIVETVREGALALGLLPEEIEAAMETYRMEEIRISMMDLSAEEQQSELEAVFSSIFDGLAGHVVPFIEQFQQVGEGLGETLIRVATGVQVTQEAVRRLGFALDETDPERFAQISEGLIGLMGGIDGMIEGMSTFLQAFATDAHRFEVAQTALASAFDEVGLTIPATRDAMWELMQSLDATTEAGREQIATLLRLAGVADEYYRLLEDRGSLEEMFVQMNRGEWSKPIQDLMNLEAAMREALDTAATLGASEMELAMIRRYYTRQLRAMSAQIMQSAMEIARQLGYVAPTAAQNTTDIELGGIGQVEQAVEDRYARELQLLQQLDDYVRNLGISALSPLTPAERLGEAESEYMRLLGLAQGGDLDALAQLQGAADAYLREAQGFYGGVGNYQDIFEAVRSQLGALVAAGPQSQQIGPQTPVFGGPVTVEPGAGWAEQNAMERAMLAQQLVDYIAALSVALGESVADIMETLGVPMTQLVEDLGINIQNITGASVEALAQLAYDLGIPLGELVAAIGLDLPALADGVRELADQMGINLGELTTETALALAGLAADLRLDLQDLTTALGIDLGRLTDANSPIFLALADTIDQLSPDIRDQLGPLLDAIRTATNEADANEALGDMSAIINTLPAGIRNLLAPYFTDVFPAGALTDLDYLGSIDGRLIDTNGWLQDIFNRLGEQQGDSMDVPDAVSAAMARAYEVEAPRDTMERDSIVREVRELKSALEVHLKDIARTNSDIRADVRREQGQRRVG